MQNHSLDLLVTVILDMGATGCLVPLPTGRLVSPDSGKPDFLFISRARKMTLSLVNVNYFSVFLITLLLGS